MLFLLLPGLFLPLAIIAVLISVAVRLWAARIGRKAHPPPKSDNGKPPIEVEFDVHDDYDGKG